MLGPCITIAVETSQHNKDEAAILDDPNLAAGKGTAITQPFYLQLQRVFRITWANEIAMEGMHLLILHRPLRRGKGLRCNLATEGAFNLRGNRRASKDIRILGAF